MPTTSSRKIQHGPDAYRVLEVSEDASIEEIRRSYKRLVLKAHPDKNPDRPEWSEQRVRELLVAFDMIGDSEKRKKYDEARRHVVLQDQIRRRSQRRPTEKDLFFFRKQDPESLALRVLYFLMNQRGREALTLVLEMEARFGGEFLRSQLDRTDYLDCSFLLGEYLLETKSYVEAHDRFLRAYELQRSPRMRRPHYDLVVDSLKALYLRHLPRVLSARELIETQARVPPDFAWTPKERARLYLARAKAHKDLGDVEETRDWVERAQALDPRSANVRRWVLELETA